MVTPMKKIATPQRAPEKDLKEDTTRRTALNAEDILQKAKPIMTIAVILCAVFYLWFWYQGETEKEANNYFGMAMVDIRVGNTEKALERLNFVLDNFSGTEVSQSSLYFIGNLHLKKGMFDTAVKYFSDYSGSDELLITASYAGTALCKEQEKKYDEAASLYQKAYDNDPTDVNAKHLFSAGVNYELAKNNEKAKSAFEAIQGSHASFAKIGIVKLKLAAL